MELKQHFQMFWARLRPLHMDNYQMRRSSEGIFKGFERDRDF